jgi:hypothetical protein
MRGDLIVTLKNGESLVLEMPDRTKIVEMPDEVKILKMPDGKTCTLTVLERRKNETDFQINGEIHDIKLISCRTKTLYITNCINGIVETD